MLVRFNYTWLDADTTRCIQGAWMEQRTLCAAGRQIGNATPNVRECLHSAHVYVYIYLYACTFQVLNASARNVLLAVFVCKRHRLRWRRGARCEQNVQQLVNGYKHIHKATSRKNQLRARDLSLENSLVETTIMCVLGGWLGAVGWPMGMVGGFRVVSLWVLGCRFLVVLVLCGGHNVLAI